MKSTIRKFRLNPRAPGEGNRCHPALVVLGLGTLLAATAAGTWALLHFGAREWYAKCKGDDCPDYTDKFGIYFVQIHFYNGQRDPGEPEGPKVNTFLTNLIESWKPQIENGTLRLILQSYANQPFQDPKTFNNITEAIQYVNVRMQNPQTIIGKNNPNQTAVIPTELKEKYKYIIVAPSVTQYDDRKDFESDARQCGLKFSKLGKRTMAVIADGLTDILKNLYGVVVFQTDSPKTVAEIFGKVSS